MVHFSSIEFKDWRQIIFTNAASTGRRTGVSIIKPTQLKAFRENRPPLSLLLISGVCVCVFVCVCVCVENFDPL
jgi:hypothetical protein